MRALALALLDDEYGINADAWELLEQALEADNDYDIIKAVKVQDGRWYLPESFFEE